MTDLRIDNNDDDKDDANSLLLDDTDNDYLIGDNLASHDDITDITPELVSNDADHRGVMPDSQLINSSEPNMVSSIIESKPTHVTFHDDDDDDEPGDHQVATFYIQSKFDLAHSEPFGVPRAWSRTLPARTPIGGDHASASLRSCKALRSA